MLLLALSCLQARYATEAAEELLALEPDGLQLTPGNIPEIEFEQWIREKKIPLAFHHGFDWRMRKRKVWDGPNCVALPGASVHPPLKPFNNDYMEAPVVLEVMYPGYGLGSGHEVEAAMERNLTLAIDVSHINIQICQRTMTHQTWERIQAYGNIAEVHVSANDGHGDKHSPLEEDSFGLSWAMAKQKAGTPMILECYMHKLNIDDRKRQLEILRS